MENEFLKLLIVIVNIVLFETVHGSDLECTEFNETRPLSEVDISRIVEEISNFRIPKLKGSIDIKQTECVSETLMMPDSIKRYNYSVETHVVNTADGYIITMFRIPSNGSAIFLMHGIIGSSDDWLIAGPNKSLALLLADEGYDVWLGNARGNRYSRKHAKMSPDCEEFWDFSCHEIGRHDLPAMMAYMLDITQLNKLSFIGHSQGTTAFFVMCSELPELNEKVDLMVALSPLAFVSHVKSPILRILSYETDIKYVLLKAIGFHEIRPDEKFLNRTALLMCDDAKFSKHFCNNINFIMYGFNQAQLDLKVRGVEEMLCHFPSSGSTRQLLHYAQGIASKSFRKYDYDETTNINLYGFSSPPSYALENITTPIALVYSDQDWMSNLTDTKRLNDKLPNVVEYLLIENYSYMDWLVDRNVKEKVYDNVRKLVKKYSIN